MMHTVRKAMRIRIWNARALYLMLLPGLVYYSVFRLAPMVGLVISFKDYRLTKGLMGSAWATPLFKHFNQFISSPYFNQLLRNTFLIGFFKLIICILPPIAFAILLSECRFKLFKSVVQTMSYMPHFLSWVIVYAILMAFLSESSGVVNRALIQAGGSAIPFLTSPKYFRAVLVFSQLWVDIGWSAIIYFAAITAIDPSLFESARIDGAGRMRCIWHITLPSIRSVIVLLMVLRLGTILDAGFDQIYVMYNIQVYSVADILDTWVYRTGLQQLNFSLGASVGMFKSLVGMALIIIANIIAKRMGERIW